MFFQSFEKISIFIYYQTYKDYIANNLCENRYTPSSNCNGQCFLMKKLRKAEKGKSTPVVPDIQKSEYIVDVYDEQDKHLDQSNCEKRPKVKKFIDSEHLAKIFHPPKPLG